MRPALAARGIGYPDVWGSRQGHVLLTDRLSRGDIEPLQRQFDAFAQSTRFHTILLSSETLAHSTDAQVQRLRELLRDSPVTIVFYFRRWSELIPSHWREVIKHGALDSLPEFTLRCLGNPADIEIVNFARVLDRYGSAFGAGNLRAVSYNAVLEAGQDLLTHFCACFLNWPDPPPTNLGRVNELLDLVDCEVIRALNALEWTRARDARENLFRRYTSMKSALPIRWLVDQAMQFTVNRVRIDDRTAGLAQLHDQIATRCRQVLEAPSPGGRLFEPRVAEIDYIQSDYLMQPGIMEALRDIQAKLLAARDNG